MSLSPSAQPAARTPRLDVAAVLLGAGDGARDAQAAAGGSDTHVRDARRQAAALCLDAGDNGGAPHFAQAILLDAAPAGAEIAPRWVQVAAEGTYAKNGQSFTLDRGVFQNLVKNFRARPSFRRGPDGVGCADVIAFDWRHASEMPPTVPGAFASQQALGWAQDLDVRSGSDGKAQLWAYSRFLPEAAKAIGAGAVKWTSVAIWPDAKDPHGKPIGWDMSSIALTNDPHIQGMVPIGATQFGREASVVLLDSEADDVRGLAAAIQALETALEQVRVVYQNEIREAQAEKLDLDGADARAGTKDGLGTGKAAGSAREGSSKAQDASRAAKRGAGSHAAAAKDHLDAAAQHHEAASRSQRPDYEAAHLQAAAAHEGVAAAHQSAANAANAALPSTTAADCTLSGLGATAGDASDASARARAASRDAFQLSKDAQAGDTSFAKAAAAHEKAAQCHTDAGGAGHLAAAAEHQKAAKYLGDAHQAARAALQTQSPTPVRASREKPMDDQKTQQLIIALAQHMSCAPTLESVVHQAPVMLARMKELEKDAGGEPGRIACLRQLLTDDGDPAGGAAVKDFDDGMRKVATRCMERKQALAQAEQAKQQLATDRDGLQAELEKLYGGQVKTEEDRVAKDVKATMERHGLDPSKDEGAKIAATGLLFERTGGVMLSAKPTIDEMKLFLTARGEAAAKYAEKYPAPASVPGNLGASSAPHLFTRYYGDGAPPAPAVHAFMRGGLPAAGGGAPLTLGNGGRPLTDGPQPKPGQDQPGLDFDRFIAAPGPNVYAKAQAYVLSLHPEAAKLERRELANLARPIALEASRLAAAHGIDL